MSIKPQEVITDHTPQSTSHDTGQGVYQYTGMLARLALAAKARRGEIIGPAPTGYINVQTCGGPRVEIDPKLGPLVHQTFELAAQGYSLRSILAQLTPKGLVSRNAKTMGPSALLNIITNPFYVGLVRYHEQLYPGAHHPLVSRSLFEQVRQKFRG